MKMRMQDEQMWFMGQYTLSAVSVAVDHCLAGRKAKSKYIDKPIMQEIGDKRQSNETLTEEEKQRAVDLFFAKEKARRVNWRRAHYKDGTGS